MAPDTQGPKVGLLEWPGFRAGGICCPCSLGLFRTIFLKRKSFSEAGLFLVGFLPVRWSQVFYSHFWLLDLKLLWGR